MGRTITAGRLSSFARALRQSGRSAGTAAKYLRDVRALASFLDGRPVSAGRLADWRDALLGSRTPRTVNSMLAAANAFCRCMGWADCRVSALRLQRQMFRSPQRELTRAEYDRLLRTARRLGRERLALLMETLCATGIRVSEVQYVTVEALRAGRADVSLKGKIRTVLIPARLSRKLLEYAQRQRIATGEVFRTATGRGLGRKQIWAEMKALCAAAGVPLDKVFPHNLRHLFARTYYAACRDVVKLADILGHSSVETTRIYLMTTGAEHARQLDRLGLIQ